MGGYPGGDPGVAADGANDMGTSLEVGPEKTMPYLTSGAINRAEYDPRTSTLSVWFVKSGASHDYYDVPFNTYEGLMHASSVRQFFDTRIRDRYSCGSLAAHLATSAG
jgi:hypothetical protein